MNELCFCPILHIKTASIAFSFQIKAPSHDSHRVSLSLIQPVFLFPFSQIFVIASWPNEGKRGNCFQIYERKGEKGETGAQLRGCFPVLSSCFPFLAASFSYFYYPPDIQNSIIHTKFISDSGQFIKKIKFGVLLKRKSHKIIYFFPFALSYFDLFHYEVRTFKIKICFPSGGKKDFLFVVKRESN